MTGDTFTLDALAAYLHYTHRSAALKWARAQNVPLYPRGRRFLVYRADVDAALKQARKAVSTHAHDAGGR